MAKKGEQRNTDSVILGILDVMQGYINSTQQGISSINTEIKDINEKLNPVCLIIKGNGIEPITDQVKKNTNWRNKVSGAISSIKWILGFLGFGFIILILKTFNIIKIGG